MAYTPSTSFTFTGGAYAPSSAFVFIPPLTTGDMAGVLAGVSGRFVAANAPQSTIAATLNGITGHVDATVAPQGSVGGTLSELVGQFNGRNLDPLTEGRVSGILAGIAGQFVAANAPQSSITAVLEGIAGQFDAALAAQGDIDGTLPGVSGRFIGFNVANTGAIQATLSGISGGFVGRYDANVRRYLVAGLGAAQGTTAALTTEHRLTCNRGVYASIDARVSQHAATRLPTTVGVCFNSTSPIGGDVHADVFDADSLGMQIAVGLQQLTSVDEVSRVRIDRATSIDQALFAALYRLEHIDTVLRHPVDDAGTTLRTLFHRIYGEPPEGYRYTPGMMFAFAANADYTPSVSFRWPYVVPFTDLADSQQFGVRYGFMSHWQRAMRTKRRVCVPVQNARRPDAYGGALIVDPPRPPPDMPPHDTFVITDQRVYIMQHALSVTLHDLTPVPMASVRLSYDADSYAWQFNGQLADAAALALITQTPGQPPVQLIITINGYNWRVLVERIEHGRQFGQRTINVIGRGLTALLGKPYEQPASATQSSALTVQQLADLQLPVGWTNVWTAATWLVSAGAHSYNNQTPIQALAGIVNDIGAMLVPARDSQTIHIMPRYPVLPWDFDAVTPYISIPESAILSLTQRPTIPIQANGVYVHGSAVGGVLGWCRLTGTAGERLMPTANNALMTDVIGCRALGSRLLAGQYTQPAIQSLTLPLDGVAIPLINVGELAEITLDNAPVRGIVNSVSIEAGLASVRQTIQIGEETPNTWVMFKDLLPSDPLLVATMSNTDGMTSLMRLLDGGVVRVRGTGVVGNKYYIRGGRIDGDAPSMVQHEVVI